MRAAISIDRIRRWWHHNWFEPASPLPVCLFRMAYGCLVTVWGLILLPDCVTWFGRSSIIGVEAIRRLHSGSDLSLWLWLNSSDELCVLIMCIFLLSSLCVTLGLFTRISTITTWFLILSIQNRNPLILNSGDDVLRLVAFLMVFAPAGQMYSLDSWIKRKFAKRTRANVLACSPTLSYPWVQRLLQFTMFSVYWQAFWSKLQGVAWWNGTAVYYVTHAKEFVAIPLPFLFNDLPTCRALTWLTLVIEFSLWSLVWIKEFRYRILLFGTLFHLAIEWTMVFPLFEYLMIALYITFIDPQDLQRGIDWTKSRAARIYKQMATCLNNYT